MFPWMGMLFIWLLPLVVGSAALALTAAARRGGRPLGRTKAGRTPAGERQSVETQILRIAAKHKGELTVTDVAMETGMGIPQAEKALDKMVDGNRVSLRVSDSGVVLYEFLEIATGRDTEDE